MSQTRRKSLVEALTNISVGVVTAMIATQTMSALAPTLGIDFHISLGSNLTLTAILTVVSVARSYTIRRLFNKAPRGHHAISRKK